MNTYYVSIHTYLFSSEKVKKINYHNKQFLKRLLVFNLNETSKFEWTLDNIRIEKIISASISPKNFFGGFQLY